MMQSSAAGAASKAAQAAQNASLAQQAAEWQYAQAIQQPYVQTGYAGANDLQAREAQFANYLSPYLPQAAANLPGSPIMPGVPSIPGLPGAPSPIPIASAPGQMTQAELAATPGYQFTLNQGLQAVQNSAAAKGLGVSGAALKGAADYATGLADSTYQTQFNIAQQRWQDQLQAANLGYNQQQQSWQDTFTGALANFGNQQQVYADQLQNAQQNFQNKLNLSNAYLGLGQADINQLQGNYQRAYNIAALGANVATGAGSQTTQAAANMGNTIGQMGQAQAAGIMGQGNALAGGLSNIGSTIGNLPMQYLMMNKLFGSPATPTPTPAPGGELGIGV
jgi:hypothetical protein